MQCEILSVNRNLEEICKNSCESKAFRLEIQRLHKALYDASLSLIDAAKSIEYYGPNPHQKGWEEDAQDARDAATRATSVTMSGVEPAQYHQSTIDQLTGHA